MSDIQQPTGAVPYPSTTVQMALNDTTQHSLVDILQRPVRLGTVTWDGTDEILPMTLDINQYDTGSIPTLAQYNFPQDIFSKSPIVVEKLKNFQYMKADIEIEIKYNAQQFLQGALLLAYVPYINKVNKFRRVGSQFMSSVTSNIHKFHSIESTDSVKLTCPYANVLDLFDLGTSNDQFGTVYIYVADTLRSEADAPSLTFTVFARFVNPQFYVPTNKTTLTTTSSESARRFVAQDNPTASSDSGETTSPGPVSRVAGTIATVAEGASGIPVLSSVASTVSWVARAVKGVASVFGWSKPVSIERNQFVAIQPGRSMIHAEGNDDSVTLAMLQDNGIDGSKMVPEAMDEMALSYIFSRPNVFHALTVPSSSFTNGNLITSWQVSPFTQYSYGQTNDSSTLNFGSFAYTSMFGSLWRGSIEYTIRCIKTKFHQGRFAVVYLPEQTTAPTDLGELLNSNYSVICDLGGANTWHFKMDFLSNSCWRNTMALGVDGAPDATTLATSTGLIALYCLNDLSFPSSVASAVTFYISYNGGPDYQIACPQMQLVPGFSSRYSQTAPTNIAGSDTDNPGRSRRFVAQSADGVTNVFQTQDIVPSTKTTDTTAQTTGEYFTSLRSLTKRFGWIANITNGEILGLKLRRCHEDDRSGQRVLLEGNVGQHVLVSPTYMASFLYRFYQGSNSIKVVPPAAWLRAKACISRDNSDSSLLQPDEVIYRGNPEHAQLLANSNVAEYRLPFYSALRCGTVGGTLAPLEDQARLNLVIQNQSGLNPSATSDLFEAAGDDFSYFFVVGPPVMSHISRDIQNVTIPNVNEVTIGTNLVTDFRTFGSYPQYAGFDGMVTQPTLALRNGILYPWNYIGGATATSFLVTYSDATAESVNISDCGTLRDSQGVTFCFPIDPQKTVNQVTTKAAVAALTTSGSPMTVQTAHPTI